MGTLGGILVIGCMCITGNNKAIAGQLQKGIGTAKAVSYWLYNMLAQPLSSDQLLIRGREATQLSAVVNSSAYDLRFVLPGQLRTSQVSNPCYCALDRPSGNCCVQYNEILAYFACCHTGPCYA